MTPAAQSEWVLDRDAPEFPPAIAGDPRPPARIYGLGDPALLQPGVARVAIIGARRCTPYGRNLARRFGADLAASGVSVVSGLALGIDGAAHEGALTARRRGRPIAVVGTGIDIVYPRSHARLWAEVAEAGCVITEFEPGTRAEPWRFPLRNRIIASLADVVLVVEAHPGSGTRHTVDAAIERGRPVMAVPGPVGSSASEGSNQLLREGCAPALDPLDVLVELGLSAASAERVDLRPPPERADDPVLACLEWSPISLDQVVIRTGLSLMAAVSALHRLAESGWAVSTDGWWQRCAAP